MRQRKPEKDFPAGAFIAALREDSNGMSRRELVLKLEIDNPTDPRMHVSLRTLTRIEDEGAIPSARIKFALTRPFGLLPSDVWGANALHRAGMTAADAIAHAARRAGATVVLAA